MINKKISLIGSGNIGGTIAHIMSSKNIANIMLVDVAPGVPQGKSLDISQMMAVCGKDVLINGSNDFSAIKGSDVIIVTAGVPRKPGMSRDDLLSINIEIIKNIAKDIKNYSPDAFVIVVTNPLDIMSFVMLKETEFDSKKVVGMAGVLDSARFSLFLSKEMNVSVSSINPMVLGGHGDTMVPLARYTTVLGVPLTELIKAGIITKEKLGEITTRTQNGGAEIVNLLKNGSAFYAPAYSAVQMAESYLLDQKKLLPITCYLNGEYKRKDIYIGVPAIIGSNGIEKIIELDLNEEEYSMFNKSANYIEKMINEIK